jgi:serine protease inhibitor
MHRPAILLLLFVFLLTSCETLIDPGPDRLDLRPLTALEKEVVEADNRFGLNVFRLLAEEDADENVFISPLSLALALGMTLNGTDGETFEAMRETMQLQGLSQDEINGAFRSLIDLLRGLDPKVDFRIANSIWSREGYPVEADFLERAEKYFDAEVSELDFGRPDAPDIINAWIERATGGMIEEMIEKISGDVIMYLINAIYFKGDWRSQFDPDDTRDAPFYLRGGGEVTVPLMAQKGTFALGYGPDYLAVDLPYGDSLYTMTLILPQGDIDAFIATLDANRWRQITDELNPTEVTVYLPRFRTEYEKELNDVLSDLGMGIAFTCGEADFSRINPWDELCISMVKQKAVVDVNEEGTEAAAATVVEIIRTSGPPTIRLDRPFVFAIREQHSGTIMFIGKMMNPTR